MNLRGQFIGAIATIGLVFPRRAPWMNQRIPTKTQPWHSTIRRIFRWPIWPGMPSRSPDLRSISSYNLPIRSRIARRLSSTRMSPYWRESRRLIQRICLYPPCCSAHKYVTNYTAQSMIVFILTDALHWARHWCSLWLLWQRLSSGRQWWSGDVWQGQ